MILHGEFRQHPYCPERTPYVPCPAVVSFGNTEHQAPGWVVAHRCHSCTNRRQLTIGEGTSGVITIDCKAADNG